MTWVVWVRMLGFRSRSAIATATPAEEDMIADVTALQVTDSHTVFSVLPHKLDPWPVRCPFRQRAAQCQRRCMTSATSTVLSCVLLRADAAVAALMTPLPCPRVPSHYGSFCCRPRFKRDIRERFQRKDTGENAKRPLVVFAGVSHEQGGYIRKSIWPKPQKISKIGHLFFHSAASPSACR